MKQILKSLIILLAIDFISMWLLVRIVNPSTIDSAIGIILFIPFIFGIQVILAGILLWRKNKTWGFTILFNSVLASIIFVQLYSMNIDRRMDVKFDSFYFNKVDTLFNITKDNRDNTFRVNGSSGIGSRSFGSRGKWNAIGDTIIFNWDEYEFKIYNDTLENFRNLNEINIVRTDYWEDKQLNEKVGKYETLSKALKNPERTFILDISSNRKYDNLPSEIFTLSNLKELHLGNHNITHIPDDIIKLDKLEYLDLRDNNISSINPKICECKNLKDLRVGGPNITTLPECLKRMSSLKNLKIQSNTINDLMNELRTFENLETAHFYFYEWVEGMKYDEENWWAIEKEMGLNK